MPNWCENFVTFRHDDLEKVKELKRRKNQPLSKGKKPTIVKK